MYFFFVADGELIWLLFERWDLNWRPLQSLASTANSNGGWWWLPRDCIGTLRLSYAPSGPWPGHARPLVKHWAAASAMRGLCCYCLLLLLLFPFPGQVSAGPRYSSRIVETRAGAIRGVIWELNSRHLEPVEVSIFLLQILLSVDQILQLSSMLNKINTIYFYDHFVYHRLSDVGQYVCLNASFEY